MINYLTGIYWGPREESRESSANRIAEYLKDLALCTPAFSKWFKKVNSPRSALIPLSTELKSISKLLETSKHASDLGFYFSAWTGRDPSLKASLNMPEYCNINASISISCGIYSTVVCNSAVLSFTPPNPPSHELLQGLLRAAVAAFDPDDGVVHSKKNWVTNPQIPIWERPSLFRYKRGIGFTGGEVEYNPATENVMV